MYRPRNKDGCFVALRASAKVVKSFEKRKQGPRTKATMNATCSRRTSTQQPVSKRYAEPRRTALLSAQNAFWPTRIAWVSFLRTPTTTGTRTGLKRQRLSTWSGSGLPTVFTKRACHGLWLVHQNAVQGHGVLAACKCGKFPVHKTRLSTTSAQRASRSRLARNSRQKVIWTLSPAL